ncbi:hypothetical protein HNQ80_004236 [Anaerosolibacter carboniphilus]|uniref:Uncharacterized protein n=1 Tax=Anaerosolibacter carboniphilus TaxID=1417629 RepID=A0A841KWN0_9FIRM|nr:hypothetical protein [Anaerosolibacter carboniphilus]MBB6218096.1 hypothetical protein [Anaerosolibacter carboniphilus]
MKKQLEINSIVVEYKNDEKAKERFIAYIVECLLNDTILREENRN